MSKKIRVVEPALLKDIAQVLLEGGGSFTIHSQTGQSYALSIYPLPVFPARSRLGDELDTDLE